MASLSRKSCTVLQPAATPGSAGDGYLTRFARDSGIREPDVRRAASLVTRMVRRHVSGGVLDEVLEVLPIEIRRLVEPMDAELLARGEP
jgi:uncharacterized protein (DUF2267 family)